MKINLFRPLLFVNLLFSSICYAQPTISSFAPDSGSIGTLITITGTNLSSPTGFTIGGVTAIVVSNTGTQLVGMVMTGAVTGTISITTSGGTANSTGNFTITPAPYPSTQQGSKLVGTGNTGGSWQGTSASISADGNTAIVGGIGDNGSQGSNGVGAVWIYTRSGGVWSQQGSKLVGTGYVGISCQGGSVALSADGNTAIVGGHFDNGQQGAAWIFTRSGGVWSQQGNKLVGTGSVGVPEQGISVSLSADGNTAIVGGYRDNGYGAAWIFTRNGNVWSQQGNKLVGTGNSGQALMGFSVSLSADGNTAILGGYQDNGSIGAAWVFVRSGGVWSQQGSKLVGTGNVGTSEQGTSISLSADGNTAIIGGYADNNYHGAVWIFIRSGGVWSQQGSKLVGSSNIGAAYQGSSVSLSADGNTAMEGGPHDNNFLGAAWLFTRSGGVWNQQGEMVGTGGSETGGGSWQGSSVSLSADGSTAIVGGQFDGNTIVVPGATWAYTIAPVPTIIAFSPGSGPVGTLVTINGTNLNTPGFPPKVTIGGVAALVISNTGTQIVAYVMPGAVTGAVSVTTPGGTSTINGTNFTVTATPYPDTQQGSKLVGTGNVGAAYQGVVSVSADGNTAIVGGFEDNGLQGAAWVYTRSGGVWSQQGTKLVGTGNTGAAQQGISVSLSADGNTAIVGGYADNTNIGAAWVYTRSGGVWSQQGTKLMSYSYVGTSRQGWSVSMSADGNTAIIGGYSDNSLQGASWIFTRNGGVWYQQSPKLVGTGGSSSAEQGYYVSISADGNTAIVGGPSDNANQGAAWVYTRSSGVWSQQGSKLVGTGGSSTAQQGSSVSLSADGNIAMVGGTGDNSGQGAVWVFIRSGGVWSQQGTKLVGTGNVGAAHQGSSVSLSGDGNTAMVTGYGDNSSVGATWVYTYSSGVWTQQGTKLVGTGNVGASQQGTVSLSANGTTALIGGFSDNGNQGAAWVFIQLHCNPSYWLGTVSDAWENPANWSCGAVPQGYTNVIVNPGTPFSPVIRSNATCRAITVNTGATLTVAPGYTLTIIGP